MKRKLWSAVFCAVVVGSLFAVEIREQKVGGETSRWFEEMVPQANDGSTCQNPSIRHIWTRFIKPIR